MREPDAEHHPAHAYIRRRGRMTKAQARAYATLGEAYAITASEVAEFAGAGRLGVEVGFGMGQALLEWASAASDWRLVGIELYQPGIGALADRLHEAGLSNVRIVQQAAQEALREMPDARVAELRIFFPDPWPKKRHHKRRLIQAEFAAELVRVLCAGGVLRLATDWAPYADWMRECFAAQPALVAEVDSVRAAGSAQHGDSSRQTTKFERRGERLGHDICDLVYRKSG